jgi:UDP:flavonoid glycosyltransferase YjiC (YdhE family)
VFSKEEVRDGRPIRRDQPDEKGTITMKLTTNTNVSVDGVMQGLIEHLLDAGRGSGRLSGAWRLARRFGEALEPLAETNFEECLDACRGADVVVYTSVGYLGYLAAEKLKVPTVGAALQPMFTPTREFPSSLAPILPGRLGPLGGAYNRLTYAATEAFFWRTFRRTVDDLRAKVGAPAHAERRGFERDTPEGSSGAERLEPERSAGAKGLGAMGARYGLLVSR